MRFMVKESMSLRVFRIDGSVYFIPITFSSQEEFDSVWTQVRYHMVPTWESWGDGGYGVRVLDPDGRIVITACITMEGFEYLHGKFALCMESEDPGQDDAPRDEAAEFRDMVRLNSKTGG
jgi:hypothetical protein